MDSDQYPYNNGDRSAFRPPGSFPEPSPSDLNGAAPPVRPSDPPHRRQTSRPNDSDSQQPANAPSGRRSSEKSRHKDQSGDGRRPSVSTRTCGKCGGGLTGQFVRALENTFHLDCFTCNDCGKVVASKFFPVPDHPPNQYPLCETDYFKRLNLICYECGGALRGSYITALDRKYHIDHFTCSVCPTVFGAQDSYYEHEGQIYCHYHYSTKFAQRCNGCQTAILKQFVEIYRNGVNQHWHPECYMIHKYWNVRLHTPGQTAEELQANGRSEGEANEGERKRIRGQEEKIEEKVLWIWRTLSAYEEKSAGCISDMLLHVSNGAYVDGVMSAKRFILHVELLFSAADNLDRLMASRMPKGLSYSREAKLLCKKVVAFFQLLAESQDTGVRRLGVTQELLSLVTGLAHYLKLLIRICLQGTLKFERETQSEQGLQQFLDEMNSLETKLEADAEKEEQMDLSTFVELAADTCPVCQKPVEDKCFRKRNRVFHRDCVRCQTCQRELWHDPSFARFDDKDDFVRCGSCATNAGQSEGGFYAVSRLQQYVHLLKVAHARLLATLKTGGALPHTSDDPNLVQYDSTDGHRPPASKTLDPPLLRSDTRSKSYTGNNSSADQQQSSSYGDTLNDIRRLRSTRMEKHLSNATKRARTSRIIGGPDGDSARPDSAGKDGHPRRASGGIQIINDREVSGSPAPPISFGQDKLQLDDIPRLVAAEQAKDQRPNANRYARGGLVQQEPAPRLQQQNHRRNTSGAQEFEKLGPDGNRPKKYFCELTALEYFIVRHVAVLSMEPLLEGQFNQEELLELIEMRKPTFWGKFGKAFQKQDKTKQSRKRGVFGVGLDQLAERDGTESSDGVGPGALRIPTVVHDCATAMRTMDMSVEGVFRKNGNIRRLREMAETMDAKGGDAVDMNGESPVQVAALLKKFLRELPDPVMTYKLHKLWITSQKLSDEDKRRRVLHLSCCLLPKAHRDTMEVLFTFLTWAASFSAVDEESGSKMDLHNLATVIAPNILFSTNKTEGMEDSFLGIEAVHQLLRFNEIFCEVPEDLQSILNDNTLFSANADITTKEILKRYADLSKPSSSTTNPTSTSTTANPSSSSAAQNGTPTLPTVAETPPQSAQQPIVHRVDLATDMHGPPAFNSAARPQEQTLYGGTPPLGPNGFYSQTNGRMAGSRDSFGPAASPARLPAR